MKRIITSIFAAAVAMSAIVYAGTPVNESALPKAALSFIAKHYPGDKVRKAEKDQGRRGVEYEVDLVSGTELEFDSEGNWREVDAARGAVVPAAVVPKGIADYVSKNMGGQSIVKIAKKRGGYKVETSNGSELMLTAEGKPYEGGKGGRRGH